ncbi:MAG: response regulator [Magnetococcales bacterium]|nr:response regulator [Magnetococcales bacterium]
MNHYAKRPFLMQWILLGMTTLLTGAVVAFDLYRDYDHRVRVERERLLAQVRVLQENTDLLLRTAHIFLRHMQADFPDNTQESGQISEPLAQRFNYPIIPGIRALLVVDAQGIVRYANLAELLQIDVSNREFFRIARQPNQQHLLHLSPPLRSRIDGRFVMHLSQAVLTAQGTFAGVVAIALEPDYFRTLMQSVLYAPDMQVTILHGGGHLFLQVPESANAASLPQSWPQSTPEWHDGRIGIAVRIQPSVLQMDQPLWMVVSRDAEAVRGDWYQDMQMYGALFALIVVLIALVLYFSQRLIHRFHRQAGAAEAALQQSDAQQREIFDHAPAIIFIKDLQGCYRLINRQFEQWMGIDNQKICGRSDSELFPAEVAARLRASDQEVLRHGTIMVEERVPMADGLRYFLAHKFLLRTSEGQPYAICGIVSDISVRKQTEEQLQAAKEEAIRANRSKTLFLAAMSHEMRTPLHAIIGMGDTLQESALNEEQRRNLHIMIKAGNMLMGLINDLLDLSKIEAGQLEMEQHPVALSALLHEVAEVMRGGIVERGVALQIQMAADVPPMVSGDGQRLRQILFNLIDNARKFTHQGSIALTVTRVDGQRICFAVSDTGIGIGAERLQEIFEPFVQGNSEVGHRVGGIGLGLSICRQLVTLMGGQIQVESCLGSGSTFSFVLPMQSLSLLPSESLPTAAAPVVATIASNGLHILAVDDAEDNLRLLEAFLKRTPHRLSTAMDGAEGLALFQSNPFDLVLMDIQMPVMDGYQATRSMREWEAAVNSVPTPIIAFTAHAMKEVSEQVLAAGCDAVLTKPLRKQNLLEMLDRFPKKGDNPSPAEA